MRSATLCCQERTKRLKNICSPPEPMSTIPLEQLSLFVGLARTQHHQKLHFVSSPYNACHCRRTGNTIAKQKPKPTCSQLFLSHSDTSDSGAVSFLMKFMIAELKLTYSHIPYGLIALTIEYILSAKLIRQSENN